MQARLTATLLASLVTSTSLLAATTSIPLALPRPDGRPGNPAKPVQVYILAGQSNMVGMGDITGARPYRTTVFLSADPALIPGVLANEHGLARHGIYQSDAADAPQGARAWVHAGGYDPARQDAARSAVHETTVALGTTSAMLPAMDAPHTTVVRAYLEVPTSGIYTVHPGYESSTYAVATLDGREVYRRNPGEPAQTTNVTLEARQRHPIEITYFKGGSAAFWMRQVDIPGRGDLETITRVDGLFPYLLDEEGRWTERRDVQFRDARLAADGLGSPLSPLSNRGRSVGPELGMGHVLGTYHDAQVLLIKTAQGNRSLGFDFRPPSSGRLQPDDENEGLEYRLMVEGVQDTLDRIAEIVPDYQGQGYEIAGFAWWQGHADRFSAALAQEYEQNLVNLIGDVRAEFDVPEMPAVVATIGFDGYRLQPQFQGIFDAQMAVADPRRHPALAGTVATVDIRDFVREVEESPRPEGHHYNRNAETYLLVGEALGRAMVRLHGGEAEPIPLSGRAGRAAAVAARTDEAEPTEAERAAARAPLQPIIRHGLAPEFIARNRDALARAFDDPDSQAEAALNGLVALYNTVGIHEYDWQPFGPHRTKMEWDYHTFDPAEQPEPGTERDRLGRYRDVTYPDGMEHWYKPGFNAQAAGWQRGLAPFASINGELKAWGSCTGGFCGCGEEPNTLWEHEVLLKRGVFAVPPIENGYVHRILIGGMSHVGAGDGARVYLNGELIHARRTAVDRRAGGRAIGTVIGKDWWPAFEDGQVHLAATSFLKYYPRTDNYGNYITVFFQRMKLPPLDL